MAWMDVLSRYRNSPGATPPNVMDDFDAVANDVPHHELSEGLEEAFRSEQTPPFEQMLGRLFEHSDSDQRAGALNSVLDAMGPGALSLGGGAIGDLLRRAARTRSSVTPDEARQIPAQDFEEVAGKAARNDPGILQRLSRFYAEHPQLVRTLGQAAVGIAMNRMAMRRR